MLFLWITHFWSQKYYKAGENIFGGHWNFFGGMSIKRQDNEKSNILTKITDYCHKWLISLIKDT